VKESENLDLLKLYEIVVEEEHHFTKTYQERLAFYSGLITALIAATVAAAFQASEWYHFAALCAGPVLLLVVSTSGHRATFGLYRRFLEAVTMRAKIEQEMGLTEPRPVRGDATNTFWASEPIVPTRQLEYRKRRESSKEFVNELLKKGHQEVASLLFRTVAAVSLLMLAALLLLTYNQIVS
jgi:hypothetical protein